MLSYEVVGDERRPHWARSLAYTVLAALGTLFSVVFSPSGAAMSGTAQGIDLLVVLVGLACVILLPAALWWRHRRPFALTVASALLSLLVPIGNTVAFITCAAMLGRRRGPAATATALLVAFTSAWVVISDALAQPRAASVAKSVLGPTGGDPRADMELAPQMTVIVVVLGWVVVALLGAMVRSRRRARVAEQAAAGHRDTVERLGDEAARREERERIAREVHDALGHRLSLLNLHAGALEANAAGDERMAASAHLVQQSAGAAIDDLRSLLDVLRQPLGDQAEIPLTHLQTIISESFGAGQPLSSNVFIQDAERAAPALSRAVYRIVQELLTNARKHAPGEAVFLVVTGSPSGGIIIDARNQVLGGGSPGGGRGLTGIAERAELLGGSVAYGLDDNGTTFRVHVELPWREAIRP